MNTSFLRIYCRFPEVPRIMKAPRLHVRESGWRPCLSYSIGVSTPWGWSSSLESLLLLFCIVCSVTDQETLRAMQRLVDILRRATSGSGEAKNPLTAGAAARQEWQQYEDATTASHGMEVTNNMRASGEPWYRVTNGLCRP